MNPLTRRQKEILDYIRNFIDENGYAPSYREIAYYFELSSTGTIAEYVNILEDKGYLTKESMDARSIQLTPPLLPAWRLLLSLLKEQLMPASQLKQFGPVGTLVERHIQSLFRIPVEKR